MGSFCPGAVGGEGRFTLPAGGVGVIIVHHHTSEDAAMMSILTRTIPNAVA